MNILYIVPNPPSLVRVRPYNLIRRLYARGHHITVATVWSNVEERHDLTHLQSHGIAVLAAPLSRGRVVRNLLRALTTGAPLQTLYCEVDTLKQTIRDWIRESDDGRSGRKVDVVHVEHLRGVRYGLHLRPQCQNLALVWDSVDCISHLFEQAAAHSRSASARLMARLELPRTRHYEGWLIEQFDQVLVTSEVDRRALETLRSASLSESNSKITVLPNGVDLTYFTPTDSPREPATILFSGKMSYHANVTAALYLLNEIMPRVWAHSPQVQVVIAGKDPAPELQRAQRRLSNVRLTGTVPDLRPYLRSATIAVSPLVYGAGIQNKVLEALACATPVVASRQAVSALATVDGEHLLVAENADTFARCILDLLADPLRRRQLGIAGRHYVEQHHDWDRIVDRLEQIYLSALVSHRLVAG
jgi:glycosyltransferase involved in cell wall biosynthesis